MFFKEFANNDFNLWKTVKTISKSDDEQVIKKLKQREKLT